MAWTPVGKQAAGRLRGPVKVAFARAAEALERVGCDSAGYRLAGEGLDKLCVVHLWGRWRLVLGFPEVDVAAVVDIGEHLDNDRSRDVYTRLYEAVGVDAPAGSRDKPPCCDESGPPVDAQLDAVERAYRALTRRRRRR